MVGSWTLIFPGQSSARKKAEKSRSHIKSFFRNRRRAGRIHFNLIANPDLQSFISDPHIYLTRLSCVIPIPNKEAKKASGAVRLFSSRLVSVAKLMIFSVQALQRRKKC